MLEISAEDVCNWYENSTWNVPAQLRFRTCRASKKRRKYSCFVFHRTISDIDKEDKKSTPPHLG